MGGDDLGSEDEFLAAPVVGSDGSADSDSEEGASISNEAQHAGKRKRKADEKSESSGVKNIAPSESKKSKQAWMQKARDMNEASCDDQASFLSKMIGATVNHYNTVGPIKAPAGSSFFERIQSIISKKKLKQWNMRKSPMVVVVCLSARRAVAVLKELASAKLRIAKLFAKHLSIEEQQETLDSGSFPIAIGTPHRLLALAASDHLSFSKTQMLVLDAHVNPKNFTVCSLPDTAPQTTELIQDYVAPQWINRKDLKVAFL